LRYFIQFSYFGAAYHGWQRQPNALSVQEVLEDCLSKLLRQSISVVGAGRTDAGVHAKVMFAHMDVEPILEVDDLVKRLNSFLPSDIAVQAIRTVQPMTHARFDALSRSYEYWLVPIKNPFYKDTAYYCKQSLDLDLMNQAAEVLLGYHDFECFSKTNTDVKTFFCDVKHAEWTIDANKWVFRITADRFFKEHGTSRSGYIVRSGQEHL
jgi:tRNA pseudouridine38-40 synthase